MTADEYIAAEKATHPDIEYDEADRPLAACEVCDELVDAWPGPYTATRCAHHNEEVHEHGSHG